MFLIDPWAMPTAIEFIPCGDNRQAFYQEEYV